MRGRLRSVLLIALVLLAIGLYLLPEYIEPQAQRTIPHDPWPVSEQSAALHASLVVGDLHSDTLLWHRDLRTRGNRGHVDLPRLREGNVALQVFPAVTKSPLGQNYDSNSSRATDLVTVLAVAQRWPLRTWTSLLERALYQAERLQRAEAAAPEELTILRSAGDLNALLAKRADGATLVGGLLATEGLHPLEGEIANVDRLFAAGYRMMGLQHFFDNSLGGSLHGESGAGLTEFGKQVVRRLDELEVVIDVAHSSPAVVDDVLSITSRPIVVSHTGIHSACPSARNIDDARMRAIAGAGGLIGIGYWAGAVCDVEPAGVVRSIRRAIELLGVEHVALGSDYDGGTTVAFDTSELAALTHEMRAQGMEEAEIRAVMGGNLIRFLNAALPQS
jgi:microsomal dipeptidase-like Zn-dependent dipeptidase